MGLIHHGVRHARTGDGLWLQPEPYLRLGVPEGRGLPLGYGPTYAAGDPIGLSDRSGMNPLLLVGVAVGEVSLTLWDLNVAVGSISAFVHAPSWTGAAVAAMDTGGLVAGVIGPGGGITTGARIAGSRVVMAAEKIQGAYRTVASLADDVVAMATRAPAPAAADDLASAASSASQGGRYVDLPTTNASSAEAVADLKEYARRSNEVIGELGPQTVVGTKGSLRSAASRDAAAERARAAAAGTPYQGQAGHVPDTAVTGQASPPGGYLDMRGNSLSIAGGCIGNCIGETIDGFTVGGQLP